ncbi:ABC transporter permease [Brevibacillus borstelensis]|uniref:ABC transporter permease n=1 Tax=Brevibacillus borstelensis TaxID=45462 RepID=UPI0030BE0263
MRTKMQIVLLLLASSLMAAFLLIRIMTGQGGYQNLFLVTPKIANSAGYDIETIEKINEEKFMLTYEIISEKNVTALHSTYDVALIGTNYTYPFVLGYNMLVGGFFTKDAQDFKSKFVVLNEKGAFETFGSLDIIGNEVLIDGNPYSVVGVINDGDEDKRNLYIPATCLAKTANTFITALDYDNGISEEYVKNEYKQIGINETRYEMINLDLISKIIQEKFWAAWEIVLGAAVILFLLKSLLVLVDKAHKSKLLFKDFYLHELLREKPAEIAGMAGAGIVAAAALGALFWLVLDIFKKSLKWGSAGELQGFATDSFNLGFLHNMTIYTNTVFAAFIIIFTLFFLSILKSKVEASLICRA